MMRLQLVEQHLRLCVPRNLYWLGGRQRQCVQDSALSASGLHQVEFAAVMRQPRVCRRRDEEWQVERPPRQTYNKIGHLRIYRESCSLYIRKPHATYREVTLNKLEDRH